MTKITLYTGGGVSLSPVYAEGRIESAYVRLVSDDGKALQKGDVIAFVVDAPISDADSWTEIDEPPYDDDIDDSEAFNIIFGGDGE